MLRALIRATRIICSRARIGGGRCGVRWLGMSREEAAGALQDVVVAYSDGAPRNDKVFWDNVAARARLLAPPSR